MRVTLNAAEISPSLMIMFDTRSLHKALNLHSPRHPAHHEIPETHRCRRLSQFRTQFCHIAEMTAP